MVMMDVADMARGGIMVMARDMTAMVMVDMADMARDMMVMAMARDMMAMARDMMAMAMAMAMAMEDSASGNTTTMAEGKFFSQPTKCISFYYLYQLCHLYRLTED